MMWIIIIITILIILGLGIGRYFFNIVLTRSNTWFNEMGHKMVNADFYDNQGNETEKNREAQTAIGDAFWKEHENDRWEVTTSDALHLQAVVAMRPNVHQWVVCIHGYRADGKRDMSVMADYFYEHGYNVLIPDLRAHGKSEGEVIGMGMLDYLDMELWLARIVEQDPEATICLYGGSMGATTALLTAQHTQYKQYVVGIIEDCGFTSPKDEFKTLLKNTLKLPPTLILFFTNIITRVSAGYSLNRPSTLDGMDLLTQPILYIHGTKDAFVDISMTQRNYEATKGKKKVVYIEGAAHFDSLATNPKQYLKAIDEYLESYFRLSE